MRVYILRHGTATPRQLGIADAGRKLTAAGKKEVRQVVRQARAAGVSPELILSSPLLRAKETAAIAKETFKCNEILETRGLLPDIPPPQIWREIRAHRKAQELLLVGHEPQLSRLAAFLLEAPLALDFKKGGLLRIDTQAQEGPPRGVLKWLLTPKLAGVK
jgi:phosphohistidine phosphatase